MMGFVDSHNSAWYVRKRSYKLTCITPSIISVDTSAGLGMPDGHETHLSELGR